MQYVMWAVAKTNQNSLKIFRYNLIKSIYQIMFNLHRLSISTASISSAWASFLISVISVTRFMLSAKWTIWQRD